MFCFSSQDGCGVTENIVDKKKSKSKASSSKWRQVINLYSQWYKLPLWGRRECVASPLKLFPYQLCFPACDNHMVYFSTVDINCWDRKVCVHVVIGEKSGRKGLERSTLNRGKANLCNASRWGWEDGGTCINSRHIWIIKQVITILFQWTARQEFCYKVFLHAVVLSITNEELLIFLQQIASGPG